MISLQSKGLSRVFSNHNSKALVLWCPAFFLVQLSHLYTTSRKNPNFDCMVLCQQSGISPFNTLSMFVLAFLPRNKCLLISWLQSQNTVILEPKKIKSVSVSIVSPSICHKMMGPDALSLVVGMLSFKSTFSLFLFHLHQEAL